jgi:hypothetical protein
LFAARGSFAFDFGALIVITERRPAFICFSKLLSRRLESNVEELLPLSCTSESPSSVRA